MRHVYLEQKIQQKMFSIFHGIYCDVRSSSWHCYHVQLWNDCRADCRFVPSQREMALHFNDISHWLGADLESALWLGLTGVSCKFSSIWWSLLIPTSNHKLCTQMVRFNFGSLFNDIAVLALSWYANINNIILQLFLHPQRSLLDYMHANFSLFWWLSARL